MATLIKATLTLKGKDALRFLEQMDIAEKNRYSPKKLAKIKKNFDKIEAIRQF